MDGDDPMAGECDEDSCKEIEYRNIFDFDDEKEALIYAQ
jgi:hypothetical protein